MRVSCTSLARPVFSDAATTAVGISRATSSAWLGPESVTYLRLSPRISAQISCMHFSVSVSIPFATFTRTICSGTKYSRNIFSVPRMNWEGDARITISASRTASAMEEVAFRFSGRSTPGRKRFLRVERIASILSSKGPQSVVSALFRRVVSARAVPHPPSPRIVIFFIFYPLLSLLLNRLSVPFSSRLILERCFKIARMPSRMKRMTEGSERVAPGRWKK